MSTTLLKHQEIRHLCIEIYVMYDDACMRTFTGSSLPGIKPLPEQRLTYFQLDFRNNVHTVHQWRVRNGEFETVTTFWFVISLKNILGYVCRFLVSLWTHLGCWISQCQSCADVYYNMYIILKSVASHTPYNRTMPRTLIGVECRICASVY